jgi:hypothetical protein
VQQRRLFAEVIVVGSSFIVVVSSVLFVLCRLHDLLHAVQQLRVRNNAVS